MNALLTGYREVRCQNRDCPRVKRGLDPMILCKALPGSQMELRCKECGTWGIYRVPVAC